MHPQLHHHPAATAGLRDVRSHASGHRLASHDPPRRSLRVRLDDLLIVAGSRTMRLGFTLADVGAARGGLLRP